jgi:ELWxxDGT repeat protein
LTNVRSVAAGPGFALVWTGTGDFTDSPLFAISAASRVAARLADVRVQGSPLTTVEWAASSTGVFFAGWDSRHGGEPWISDGTPAGTHVLDLVPGVASSAPHAFTASDAGVFFAARDLDDGEELWIAEGAGARRVADLAPGRFSSSPSGLVAGPGGLLFSADDGASGIEPWFLEWTPSDAGAAADGGAR